MFYSDDFDADFDYPDNWLDEPEGMTDVEADANTFASAGWGTDEDYGYYGAEDAALEYAWGDC